MRGQSRGGVSAWRDALAVPRSVRRWYSTVVPNFLRWRTDRVGPLVCLWGVLAGVDATTLRAGEPPAPTSSTAASPAPPVAADAATLATPAGRPADEPPHNVRRHYMWSNERRHDLFFADLTGLGGGYLGVGGDQNYTMAAAAQTQVLWLVDLDAAVVRMHRLYAALLAAAGTPTEFVALLDPARQPAVERAVAAYYPQLGEAERSQILAIYHTYRDDLSQHLRKCIEYRWAGRAVTWLGDPTFYEHIRKLAVARLIVPRLGDLTGPSTMQEIAQAARAAGVPLRVLYLSNAESWFHYGREFRRNLDAQPFDDRSLVLRTVKSELLTYPHGDIWHYSIQSARHFTEHLRDRGYESIDTAMLDAPPCYRQNHHPGPECSVRGLSHIGTAPPAAAGAATAAATVTDDAHAARQKRRHERELHDQREQLLAQGLVTRPEGNREKARLMDREREKRLAAAIDPAARTGQ